MMQQMDTSGACLKESWKDYNILKATDNIKMAREEVNVSWMKGGLATRIMVHIVTIWIC